MNESNEPTLRVADPKSGWCNSCDRRPPYSPNVTYQLRAKTVVLTFCPTCATAVRDVFTKLLEVTG